MEKLLLLLVLIFLSIPIWAQRSDYKFKDEISLPTTSVKDQAQTGTCWCFATTSFMESELLRKGKGEYDLSEMYIVRQKYLNQIADNFLRQGKGNITQGSLSHTFMNAFRMVGIVPENAYKGLHKNYTEHNHNEFEGYMKAISDESVRQKRRNEYTQKLINALMDIYFGTIPEAFTYNNVSYTPESFTKSLELNMDDYIELTSFTHKPFYKTFSPEIPDNWEHQQMYNIPLDELLEVMQYALRNGYTICWDGDVSEDGFRYRKGYAIFPDTEEQENIQGSDRARFDAEYANQIKAAEKSGERFVTPKIRQDGYETFVTTDDHLMHITGIAKESNGTLFFKTKNSWGDSNLFHGYLYLSENFVRAKTIYIMLHKDAIPASVKQKLGL